MNEILSKIKTPAYVCEEAKVRKNLELLKRVKIESGAKVLVALKGFAFSGVMGLVGEYLDGATCSGLHEAKFAAKYVRGEISHSQSTSFLTPLRSGRNLSKKPYPRALPADFA